MNQERYIPASRTAQILLLIMVIIGFLIFAVIHWLSGLPMPPPGSASAALDGYVHTVKQATWILFAVSIPISAAWSYYMARMGYRGLVSKEFPPPGTLVVTRTRIRTGRTAVFSSWLAIVMAVVFWSPVVILWYSLFLIDKFTY
jgi:hypothetical protein